MQADPPSHEMVVLLDLLEKSDRNGGRRILPARQVAELRHEPISESTNSANPSANPFADRSARR
jgi:hypothetical protein